MEEEEKGKTPPPSLYHKQLPAHSFCSFSTMSCIFETNTGQDGGRFVFFLCFIWVDVLKGGWGRGKFYTHWDPYCCSCLLPFVCLPPANHNHAFPSPHHHLPLLHAMHNFPYQHALFNPTILLCINFPRLTYLHTLYLPSHAYYHLLLCFLICLSQTDMLYTLGL